MCYPITWLERRWSGVIFTSSFVIQFLSMGAPFSVGVFNVEFLKYFNESRATTAWISAINIAFLLGAGPLVAYMLRWFTHRQVVCTGIIVTVVGFGSCYFANSIAALCVCYGAIGGFGLAMMYLPSTVLVGYYYTKYRSIMTALSTTGGWLGVVILPKILTVTIEKYTWRGSMVILAAISLQMLVFAALLREPSKERYAIEVLHDDEKVVLDIGAEGIARRLSKREISFI